MLSLFPALLVLVSLLGLAGKSATDQVLENLRKLAPGSARDIISDAVTQLQGRGEVGSLIAVVGLVLAVWSASGYVVAFTRTANAVYDMPEGRPVWKVMLVPGQDKVGAVTDSRGDITGGKSDSTGGSEGNHRGRTFRTPATWCDRRISRSPSTCRSGSGFRRRRSQTHSV
ncbi:hypothetical protein SUDANB23_06713 (plasmid) [Streptomyces sp. enrichment culture]